MLPCSRQQRCGSAVKTLCNRLERHAAAFILNMLKTNAGAWRLHSVLISPQWGRDGNALGLLESREHVVGAPRACCEDA